MCGASPPQCRDSSRPSKLVSPRWRSRSRTQGGCSSSGRGPEFATAREIALKLLETCRIAAEPLTATDLAHGPVAALDSLFPVWAIASDETMLPAVVEAAKRAREAGATIVASGEYAESIPGAEYVLPSPKAPSSLVAPLLSVIPGQLFAWALARARGLDPDSPRGLSKVTLAR